MGEFLAACMSLLLTPSAQSDEVAVQARRQADWTKFGAIAAGVALLLNFAALVFVALNQHSAQQQADYARSAQRGWVTLGLSLSQPPSLALDHTGHTIWVMPTNYKLNNIGGYPVSNIAIWANISRRFVSNSFHQVSPGKSKPDNTEEVASITCTAADSFSKTGMFTNFLFPKQEVNVSGNVVDVSHPVEQMVDTGQLVLSVCVSYKNGLDNKSHHTSNTFMLTRNGGKFDNRVASVPFAEISIIPAGFSPAFAD